MRSLLSIGSSLNKNTIDLFLPIKDPYPELTASKKQVLEKKYPYLCMIRRGMIYTIDLLSGIGALSSTTAAGLALLPYVLTATQLAALSTFLAAFNPIVGPVVIATLAIIVSAIIIKSILRYTI